MHEHVTYKYVRSITWKVTFDVLFPSLDDYLKLSQTTPVWQSQLIVDHAPRTNNDLLMMVDVGDPSPIVLLGIIVTEYTCPEETFFSVKVLVGSTVRFVIPASLEMAMIL